MVKVINELSNGWVESTLGEIGKVSMCRRILKKQTSETGDIPFFKIGTFGKDANAFITDGVYQEFKEKYPFPKKGDILISASGTIGRRVVYDGKPAYFQDSNIVWIDNDESVVLNEYLYMFYGACDWNPSTGATIARLYNDDLRRIKIQFPECKKEQKRIVTLLDSVFSDLDKTRSKTEQNLINARELFDSYLNQVFSQKGKGWDEKKLIDVCVLQRGFDLPKRLRTKGKYPLVSSSGAKDSHNEAKVTGPGVVTGRSGTIGNVFYIEEDFWPLNTALYIKEFHGNNEKFISWLLRYFDLSRFMSGAGVPTLNRNFVHDELVCIPVNIDEQVALVAEIESLKVQVDNVISIYNKKLTHIDELKKSFLQQVFSGKLIHD